MTTGSTGILPVTRPRWPWYVAGFSFLLSIFLSLWLIWGVGRNLGLFFGGLAFAAVLAPALVLGETSWRARVAVGVGIVSGIAVVWVSCIFNDAIDVWEWCRAVSVLAVFVLALSGVAALLVRIRIPPAASAAIVVIIAVAWLGWPIWLAPWLRGAAAERVVSWLVAGNPVFAIQGALIESFPVPWPQQTIAYRLTNLGDDISYQMPTSIWRCVIGHGLIAIIGWSAAHWPARRVHPPAGQ